MARTAKLELEVDSARAKDGASTAAKELNGVKRAAADAFDEMRKLGRGGNEAGASMSGAGRAAGTAGREIRGAGDSARSTAREMRGLSDEASKAGGAIKRTAGGVGEAINMFGALRAAVVGFAGVGLAKNIIESADAVRGWNAQLKLAIAPSISLANAQKEVRRLAAETRSGLDETNELYSKFSLASRDLGRSQIEAGRATETFAKVMRIGGTSAAEAAGLTRQFGQALGSGTLRGDEFNSMMENSPRLARLLADSLGVNVGKLREMAAEGELTSDKLMNSLTDKRFTDAIDKQFTEIPITFDQAMQRVTDTATVTFAAFDRGGEFSQSLINFMLGGVENMDKIETRAEQLGIELRATFGGLDTLFAPMADGAETAFEAIGFKIASAQEQIAGFLGILDTIKNGGVGLDRGLTWFNNLNPFKDDKPMPGWSNMAGDYTQRFNDLRQQGELKAQERRVHDSIPEFMRGDTPKDLRAFLNGAYLNRKPPGANNGGAEIGRAFTSADLDKALAGLGARVTSRTRTPAQQQALINKWEREDPRTRGIRPAAADRSDHVVNGALTRDIGKGAGISLASITAAVGKDNIKQLLDEGDHFHLAAKAGGAAGGRSGKSDAEREAERLERARKKRAEDEADFYQQLSDQTKLSALLPAQAEQFNAELRLRKILNDGNVAGDRELSKGQKERIALALQERNTAEFVGSAKRDALTADRERLRLEDIGATLSKSTAATEADNLAVQQRLWPMKLDAMQRGLSLQDATVAKTLAEAEARERGNLELEKRNRLIEQGIDVAREYGGPAVQQGADRAALEEKKVAAAEALWAGRLSPAVYEATVRGLERAMYEVDSRFRDEFFGSITTLAGHFEGKFGAAVQGVARVLEVASAQTKGDFSQSGVIGSVIGLFNGKNGNRVADSATESSRDMLGKLMSSTTFTKPLASLSEGFTSFKGDFKNIFGKGGDFGKGLGSALGKAGMGASIGGATSDLAGLVGIKLNRTGSQVGGAIGSIGGPLGSIAGSIAGGIIGNLFSKPKTGSSSIGLVDGMAGQTGTGGNDATLRRQASGLTAPVATTLNNIVEQLGGKLGDFAVSIGMRDGKYVVDNSGRGSTKFGKANDGITAYKTAEEAQAAALKNAIQDGAFSKLGPTIQRIINGAGDDIDKAVRDALTFKSVQDAYRQMTDPLNYALQGLNTQFEDLAAIMRKAGATSQEWSNAEAVYQKQRADIIEQGNASAVKAMKDYLFGLTAGPSSVLSPETRLANSTAALDELDAKKRAGGIVDFDAYRSTADAFLAASRDAKGSTSSYFADLQRVTDSVNAMLTETKAVTTPELDLSPVVSALDSQTTQLISALQQINGTLGSSYSPAANPGYSTGLAVNPTTARYYAQN